MKTSLLLATLILTPTLFIPAFAISDKKAELTTLHGEFLDGATSNDPANGERNMDGFSIGPVEEDQDKTTSNVAVTEKSGNLWCGQLRYEGESNGWFRMRGVANGQLIVNFSENGIIRSRIHQYTVNGAFYNYDTKNYRYQVGFTCL